jgi:hypothetical protein
MMLHKPSKPSDLNHQILWIVAHGLSLLFDSNFSFNKRSERYDNPYDF